MYVRFCRIKCFACHGPDANKREAGLRLDVEESAYAALQENPEAHAIVPGEPTKSEVIRRILTSDPDEKNAPSRFKFILK